MITIRFTPPLDLELAGSREDLTVVRRGVMELAASGTGDRVFQSSSDSPTGPYEHLLGRLRVAVAAGPVRVAVELPDELRVSGAVVNLERFASFLEFSDGTGGGCHSHYEHFPGNQFIAPDSVPLVVSLVE